MVRRVGGCLDRRQTDRSKRVVPRCDFPADFVRLRRDVHAHRVRSRWDRHDRCADQSPVSDFAGQRDGLQYRRLLRHRRCHAQSGGYLRRQLLRRSRQRRRQPGRRSFHEKRHPQHRRSAVQRHAARGRHLSPRLLHQHHHRRSDGQSRHRVSEGRHRRQRKGRECVRTDSIVRTPRTW